ncbi:hypothetical protein JdFRA1000001_04 [uncultured archaeal virus]|uniref:Uncharacterized protein n=1 Tax=uncultured archaeal virus TaxID=1960247 RepID=A0A1S5Y2T8_9VIRU|nr:hypothetical protein JdFRA1000001_04 [uncultured archaeal virus]
MYSKDNIKVVLEILDMYNHFLDKAEKYPYLPGDLKMVINRGEEDVSWSILKNPYIDALDPQRMFFEEVYELFNETIWVRDHRLSIKTILEDIYGLSVNQEDEDIALGTWVNIGKLESIKELYPTLYQIIKNRWDAIMQVSSEHGIAITNVLDEESKYVWLEIEIDSYQMSLKEKIKEVFDSIEILREIYKRFFNCKDEDQEYDATSKEPLINQLRTYLYSIYELVTDIKDKVVYEHIGLFEWPGFNGEGFTLWLKTPNVKLIDINVERKIGREISQNYKMSIRINADKDIITRLPSEIPIKSTEENWAYYQETTQQLKEIINEIKNLIKIITEL